jgi:hypothetical protein
VAFNTAYVLIPWSWVNKEISSDIGGHRAKKVGFKTCAIIILSTAQENRNEDREH